MHGKYPFKTKFVHRLFCSVHNNGWNSSETFVFGFLPLASRDPFFSDASKSVFHSKLLRGIVSAVYTSKVTPLAALHCSKRYPKQFSSLFVAYVCKCMAGTNF